MLDSILIRKFLLVQCHNVLWIIVIYHLQQAILSRKGSFVIDLVCNLNINSFVSLYRGSTGVPSQPTCWVLARALGIFPIYTSYEKTSSGILKRSFWWELRESNPRPSACKADALNQLS